MKYLLDTNVVSDLVRDPGGRVAQRIAGVGEAQVCTSIIVAAELRFGAAKKRAPRLTNAILGVLERLPVLTLSAPAEVRYAELRASLESRGTPIGGNDLLIAAHALALRLTVVTDNEREFSRVEDLRIENWLK